MVLVTCFRAAPTKAVVCPRWTPPDCEVINFAAIMDLLSLLEDASLRVLTSTGPAGCRRYQAVHLPSLDPPDCELINFHEFE
jgi:hypothetical protein